MDSLLTNYASSSSEESESEEISLLISPPKSSSSLFSSLPPKSSIFSSPSSIFSSLPNPNSQSKNPTNKPSSDQNPKKIVHFTPPLNPSILKSQHPDDIEDEEDKKRKARQITSSSSTPKALFAILPAPKNSLLIAPAQSSGAARRSNLQMDSPSTNPPQESNYSDGYEAYGGYSAENGVIEYGSYVDNSSDVSVVAETSEIFDIGRIVGKRGRADVPIEIVEVKQDELMKNRPREDQVKSTGIAFGPAYQSAPSTKGKPSKLHKRKHQIGSLFYDVKQKEMELAERRSKGLLTKTETHAKYGW